MTVLIRFSGISILRTLWSHGVFAMKYCCMLFITSFITSEEFRFFFHKRVYLHQHYVDADILTLRYGDDREDIPRVVSLCPCLGYRHVMDTNVWRHVVLVFVITSTLFTGLRCDFSVLSLVDKYYIVLPECNPDFWTTIKVHVLFFFFLSRFFLWVPPPLHFKKRCLHAGRERLVS